MSQHPLDDLLRWFPELDFAVLHHGLAEHGRDYIVIGQFGGVRDPGTYELVFTHCAWFEVETRVRDEVWPVSWGDELTDYDRWLAAGSPDGYVWGTNWSLADPGLQAVSESPGAATWSRRLGHPMHELTLETDRFRLRLIFHEIRTRKLSEEHDTVDQVIIPMPPPESESTA